MSEYDGRTYVINEAPRENQKRAIIDKTDPEKEPTLLVIAKSEAKNAKTVKKSPIR